MSNKVYIIVKKLQELLKDEPVYKVTLFGSYVKNEANKERMKKKLMQVFDISKIGELEKNTIIKYPQV